MCRTLPVLQVVKLANDNPYGLASGVLAKDQGVIDGLVRRIRAGTVWVNTYNIYDAGGPEVFSQGRACQGLGFG